MKKKDEKAINTHVARKQVFNSHQSCDFSEGCQAETEVEKVNGDIYQLRIDQL